MTEDFRGTVEFSWNQSQDGDTDTIQFDIVHVITARLMKSLNLQYDPKEASVERLCSRSDSNLKSLVTSDDGLSDSVAEDLSPKHPCSLSLPTLSRLVSALKGSREKLGAQPKKKVSVSWAPDVYDPIPNPAYQEPNNNKKKDKNKKKEDKKKESSGKNTRPVEMVKKSRKSFFTSMDNFEEDI